MCAFKYEETHNQRFGSFHSISISVFSSFFIVRLDISSEGKLKVGQRCLWSHSIHTNSCRAGLGGAAAAAAGANCPENIQRMWSEGQQCREIQCLLIGINAVRGSAVAYRISL